MVVRGFNHHAGRRSLTLCSSRARLSRAQALCNVSELERLGIGKDRKTELRIIKANKIIPKCIAVVRAEGSYEVPTACPSAARRPRCVSAR